MAAFKRQQLGGLPKDSAADGTTADSSRPGPSSNSKPNMLHHVSPLGPGWHHSDDSPAINGVEEDQNTWRRTPSSTTPLSTDPHHAVGKGPEDYPPQQTGEQASRCQSEIIADPRGQELALSSMVPSEKGIGDQWQEALHPDGRNAAEPHAACGTLQGGGFKAQNSQDPVVPWKLDLDVKTCLYIRWSTFLRSRVFGNWSHCA